MKRLVLAFALAACANDRDRDVNLVDAGGAVDARTPQLDGTAPDGPIITPPDAAPTLPSGAKRVFVTSLRYPADLRTAGGQATGRASADAICQTLADASSLGGTFVAWLSTSTSDAIDHVSGVGPWYRMDGVKVFANHANLGTTPAVAITVDETLGTPDPYFESWTGTSLGGHRSPLGSRASVTCNDWTSTAITAAVEGTLGVFGNGYGQDVGHGADWTQFGMGSCGPYARHLYCFEQ